MALWKLTSDGAMYAPPFKRVEKHYRAYGSFMFDELHDHAGVEKRITNPQEPLGNALQSIHLFFYCFQDFQGDRIEELANFRVELMQYPDFEGDSLELDYPYIAMMKRMVFDKTLKELGGYRLQTEVMKKLSEVTPSKDLLAIG